MQSSKETNVTLKRFCEQNPGDEEEIMVHNSKCNFVFNQLFVKGSHQPSCVRTPHSGRHTGLTRHV